MTEGPYKLPHGWRWVRLGEVCSINPRRPRFSIDPKAPTTFVPMSAVDAVTGTITTQKTRPFEHVRRGYTYFEEGDVLFAKITPSMENGKSAIAKGLIGGIGFGSTEFHVLRPTREVLPDWIWYFVRREDFRIAAKASFRGAVGHQRVPPEFLQESIISLPPLSEQRRIVTRTEELLNRIREAHRLRDGAGVQTEQLWHSILANTFPVAGSDTPPGWRWVRLGEVCLPTETQNPSKYPSRPFTYVDISAVDSDEGRITAPKRMLGEEAPSRARRVIRSGDVIFATTRPYLKNIALVGPELEGQICSTGFCVLRANRHVVDPLFLYFLCRSDVVVSQLVSMNMRGASYPAVTDRDVFNVQIPLPPPQEQRRIVALLDALKEKVKELKAAQAEAEAKLQSLERSILDKTFRGEL